MEKINVKVNQTTREVGLTRQIVGNQLENLQDELVFSFTDKFVDGQARLEYEIDNTKYWVTLDKVNETYTLPLNSQITSQEEVFMQLVISVDNGTFKSNVFSLYFANSINATTEAPEQYPTWLDKANEKLNQMDNINITANKVDNVATITVTRKDKTQDTVQIEDGAKGDKGDKGDIGLTGNGISKIEKVDSVGLKTNYKINFTDGTNFNYSVNDGKTPIKGTDYYTEQDKQEMVNGIVTDANSDFNVNAEAKTNEFNSNAEAKINTFNSNASSKVGEYNTNAKKELGSYNDNATTKLKAYNDNHTAKLEEYNNNSIVKVGNYNDNADKQVADFNTNVITKTSEYNENATTKYNAYNTNDEEKLANYNSNDETKLKAYNDNHTTKLSEYNENAINKINEFDRLADVVIINKNISSNTKRIKNIETNIFDSGVASGENINIKDSALAEFQEIKSSINKAQKTYDGYNLCPINFSITELSGVKFIINEDKTITANGKSTERINIYIADGFKLPTGNMFVSGTPKGGHMKYELTYSINNFGGSLDEAGQIINNTDANNKWRIRLDIRPNVTLDNVVFKPMITLESNKYKPYEPYTGGIASPNPDYPQEINTIKENWETVSCGRNFFNAFGREKGGDLGAFTNTAPRKMDATKFYVGLAGSNYYAPINVNSYKISENEIMVNGKTSSYGLNIPFKLIPNKDYYVVWEGGYVNVFIGFYDVNGNFIDSIALGSREKITPPSNCDITCITFVSSASNTDTIYKNFMLKTIKEDIPYEPYQSISTPNDLKGNEFLPGDNIIKKFNVEDGKYWAYLEKNMVKYKFTGEEGWTFSSLGNGRWEADIRGSIAGLKVFSGGKKLCNKFVNYQLAYTDERLPINSLAENVGFTSPIAVHFLIFVIDFVQTKEDWVNWLKTNDVYVVGEAANKQLIPIAPLDQMNMTYNPETNLFSSVGNIKIEAKYYREFATTIRNMQIDNGKLQEQLNDMEKRIVALENRPVVVNEEVANA